ARGLPPRHLVEEVGQRAALGPRHAVPPRHRLSPGRTHAREYSPSIRRDTLRVAPFSDQLRRLTDNGAVCYERSPPWPGRRSDEGPAPATAARGQGTSVRDVAIRPFVPEFVAIGLFGAACFASVLYGFARLWGRPFRAAMPAVRQGPYPA